MNLKKKFAIGASAALMVLSLAGCSTDNNANGNANTSQLAQKVEKTANPSASEMANQNYKSNTQPYEYVNHDKSTLSRKWKADYVIYSNLDKENRTSVGNTAWLDRNNVANDRLRTRQTVQPTGWHQKFVGQSGPIINRGHEIAYSLSKGIDQKGQYNPRLQSGDQNNMKNLFTQTAFSNQKVQTIFESKVRNALLQGKKVIYQVQPIFKGTDLMPKGVHMQAVSTDGSLNFNVYLFNVQPGVQFNYANGRSRIDNDMKVVTPAGAPTFSNDNQKQSSYRMGGNYNQGYRGYGRRRNHHLVRKAIVGYALYRYGKHRGKKQMIKRMTPRRHHVL